MAKKTHSNGVENGTVNGHTGLDLEKVESEEHDSEYSPARYDIVTYPADYTLNGIVAKLEEGKILVPPFQRSFVWTHSQASKLIESFLLGLPVPPIFLYVLPGGKMLVVDGQQRLKTIRYFWEGFFGPEDARGKRPTFRLALSDESDYKGLTYATLRDTDDASFTKLNDSVLRSFIIKQLDPKDDTSIVHIFERLNTGGVPLVGQEVRNCVYNGPFNDLLRELNKLSDWREIVGKKSDDKRQRDIELILRFFALLYNAGNYKKPMKEFLTGFMRDNRNPDASKLIEFRTAFTETVKNIRAILGEKPFHIHAGLNVAAFDAVAVAFASTKRKITPSVKMKYAQLIGNKKYLGYIMAATTDVEIVKKRLALARTKLFGR